MHASPDLPALRHGSLGKFGGAYSSQTRRVIEFGIECHASERSHFGNNRHIGILKSHYRRISESVSVPGNSEVGPVTSASERADLRSGDQRPHSFTFRSRNAFPITLTLENVMAALAIIGLSSSPNTG